MKPNLATIRDGKQFHWDGLVYESRDKAAQAAAGYKAEGFEVITSDEEQAFLVYTRRVVKEDQTFH